MPVPPTQAEMVELDPEMSSTGLTNIVAGRLSFFEAKSTATPADDSHSSLPTPSKDASESNCDESFEDFDMIEGTQDDGYEVIDSDETSAKRDELLASLKGSKAEIKQAIGERLYALIHAMHGELAGKLTGMFLEASESTSDLALLIFSDSSLRFHCEQALLVLNAVSTATPAAASSEASKAPASPSSPVSPDAPGAKRQHSSGHSSGPQQYPYNGKKAKHTPSARPFFAEITCDSGKRTRVPCRYDTVHKMYVPTGGRMDSVSGAKKVGTRDKTPEDLQALELGEGDEGKLRARLKQIDIGKNTEGYRRLLQQGLRGRPLQDIIGLPYITEEGVLEQTLKCSKKRYDGYLRMWKRKLYEFSGLQKMDLTSFPPMTPPKEGEAAVPKAQGQWASVKVDLAASLKANAGPSPSSSSRKQSTPSRHAPQPVPGPEKEPVAPEAKSWADRCT